MVYLNYKDRKQVKNYLNYKLSKNKLFKGYSFYKNLCGLYEHYPDTIKEIIINIPKITYYKDYFRILNLSKNEQLNDYIYGLLLSQIKEDIQNYKNNQNISTLAKWLPRKGREFDKKLDFVNKFSEKLFPIAEGKKKSRLYLNKKYKKTIAELTKYLNPIEVNLCSKQYDKINLNTITAHNNITYNKKLKNIDIDYNEHINNNIEDLNYYDYIKKIFWINNLKENRKTLYEEEKGAIQNIWEKHFEKYLTDSDYDFKDRYLILDLSTSLINDHKLDLFKIILYCLYLNNVIIINKKKPVLIFKKDNIFETFETIYQNVGIYNEINIFDIDKLILDNELIIKKYIIITDKPTASIKNIDFDHIKLMKQQLVKIKNNYYEGNPLYYEKINNKHILIKNILDQSKELNKEENYLINLIMIFTLLLYFYLIQNFYLSKE